MNQNIDIAFALDILLQNNTLVFGELPENKFLAHCTGTFLQQLVGLKTTHFPVASKLCAGSPTTCVDPANDARGKGDCEF